MCKLKILSLPHICKKSMLPRSPVRPWWLWSSLCLDQHSHCFLSSICSFYGLHRIRKLFSFLLYLHLVWPKPFSLQFIFKYEGFDKPFFTTFFKTSSFMIYLTGFLFYEPWRLQCIACLKNKTSSNVSDKKDHLCRSLDYYLPFAQLP